MVRLGAHARGAGARRPGEGVPGALEQERAVAAPRRRSSRRSSSSTTTSPSTAPRPSASACSRSGTRRSRRSRSDDRGTLARGPVAGSAGEGLHLHDRPRSRPGMTRAATGWLGLAWLGASPSCRGTRSPGDGWLDSWLAPALPRRAPRRRPLLQGILHGRPWLLPTALPLLLAASRVAAPAGGSARRDRARGWRRRRAASRWIALQGFAIGHRAGRRPGSRASSAPRGPARRASAWGRSLLCLACLVLLCHGLAARGFMQGRRLPRPHDRSRRRPRRGLRLLAGRHGARRARCATKRGALAPTVFLAQAHEPVDLGPRLPRRPAPLRRGLEHAVSRGPRRSRHDGPRPGLRAHRHPHGVSRQASSARRCPCCPIITPPFVIGLALILLFGRSGAVTALLSDWFGIPRTRWIYGLPGVLIAQLLAFTPIAFLVLIGVVQGISPSLEEAAQTLAREPLDDVPHGDAGRSCGPGSRTRSCSASSRAWPISAIRWCSAGNYERPVDPRSSSPWWARRTIRAARPCSPIVLLAFTLAGVLRAAALARPGGLHHGHRARATPACPCRCRAALRWGCYARRPAVGALHARDLRRSSSSAASCGPWGATTRRPSQHYRHGLRRRARGVGRPPLHGIGLELLLDHDRDRRHLGAAHRRDRPPDRLSARAAAVRGPGPFEFGTMLSFAIPGTVIGVATSSPSTCRRSSSRAPALILVLCFVFRNMPVGVRAGIAALAPDRPEPRRGLAHPGRAHRHHDAPGRAAAAPSGDRGRAGLQLRPRDDRGQRGDLPGQRAATTWPPPTSSAGSRRASSAWPSPTRRS